MCASPGTEHVEEFETDDPLEPAVAFGEEIEELLRVAVHVERPERRERSRLRKSGFESAVGGSGTRVDEARAGRERDAREPLRVLEVVADEIGAVGLGRRGTGAEVEDRADRPEGVRVAFQAVDEVVGLDVIREAQADEVLPLGRRGEPVGRDDVVDAARVEAAHEIAPDEAGRAGDERALHATRTEAGVRTAATWSASQSRSASSTQSAGVSRIVSSCVSLQSTPRAASASQKGRADARNSTPTKSPAARTPAMSGDSIARRRAANRSPRTRARSGRRSSIRTRIAVRATAHASGLPPYVLPWLPGSKSSSTSRRPTTAETG